MSWWGSYEVQYFLVFIIFHASFGRFNSSIMNLEDYFYVFKPHFTVRLVNQGIHIHIDDVGRFLETDELLGSADREVSSVNASVAEDQRTQRTAFSKAWQGIHIETFSILIQVEVCWLFRHSFTISCMLSRTWILLCLWQLDGLGYQSCLQPPLFRWNQGRRYGWNTWLMIGLVRALV